MQVEPKPRKVAKVPVKTVKGEGRPLNKVDVEMRTPVKHASPSKV